MPNGKRMTILAMIFKPEIIQMSLRHEVLKKRYPMNEVYSKFCFDTLNIGIGHHRLAFNQPLI